MSAEFDGTGFMNCDVSRVGAENALIGAEQRIDYGGIRLGAADEEIDACLRSTAGFADLIPGRFGELVETVPRSLHHICGEKLLHDEWMGAFHVVTCKF